MPRMLSRLNEENLWEFALLVARFGGGELHDGPEVKWTCTTGPLFNRVFAANFADETATERIGDVVGEFLSRGANATWITGPSTRPANLGSRIERCGFVHTVDWTGMDVDPAWVHSLDQPDGCRVEEVLDHAALSVWVETMRLGFGFEVGARDAIYEHLSRVGLGDPSPLKHYLVYHDDAPCAVSTLFCGSRVGGIYFVATVPSARRKGLAGAATLRALEDAKQQGYSTVILQSSRMGERLYRKLGFERRCSLGVFFLDTVGQRR